MRYTGAPSIGSAALTDRSSPSIHGPAAINSAAAVIRRPIGGPTRWVRCVATGRAIPAIDWRANSYPAASIDCPTTIDCAASSSAVTNRAPTVDGSAATTRGCELESFGNRFVRLRPFWGARPRRRNAQKCYRTHAGSWCVA